ncbi:MAG: hypothetical protein M3P10_02435 [Actinomycetota bacterium]|nr:hypothetical protein [Actinomycetota bacterium]
MRGITRVALPALLATALTIMAAGPASAAVPTNDDFANATVVLGPSFTDATVNTTEATTQATDPADCAGAAHSVWYAYTADGAGSASFDTFGSDFDTALSAYTGTEGSLTLIACNDDSNNLLQSQITFDVTSGTTYYFIVVGCCQTVDGFSGNLVVNADVPVPETPFTFDVSFSSASIDMRTHETTIEGTVVCSDPGVVDVAGELRQRLARGSISVEVACSADASTFTPAVSPSDGSFMPGRATIGDVLISGCGATDCDSESLEGVVTTVKVHP